MSTAKPHFNKQTGAYTSPRQQGAGVVDTMAATSTDLFVTGTNNYPSVTLGNVGDKFTFEVTIHNISDKRPNFEDGCKYKYRMKLTKGNSLSVHEN